MKQTQTSQTKKTKTIVKKCHCCGHLNESEHEIDRCYKCRKSFLPSQYFNKVHAKTSQEYKQLFSSASELHEEDLIKGLIVLW